MPGTGSRLHYSPALSAACAAAAGFYCLSALYRSGIIGVNTLCIVCGIPAAALCLLWVVASTPFLTEEPYRQTALRRFRVLSMHCAACAAGLAIGCAAGAAADTGPGFGMSETALRAVSGVLREDPRILSSGRVVASLSLRESTGTGDVRIGNPQVSDLRVSARGELPLFFPAESAERLREFGRGTAIFAEGNVFRGTDGAYLFSAQSLHIVKPAPAIERMRTGIRLGLIKRFNRLSASAAPDDASWGGLALALLIGIRDSLDTGLALQYRNAGCSHVLALSGMHLAILASMIAFVLKKPLGLRAAAITGSLLIILYCFIAGPLPSLNRAALMYLLGMLAVIGMLRQEPLSLLGMAFALQIIMTPAAGRSLSFMLSYLALAGILLTGESLNNLCRGIIPAFLRMPLSASIGAFLATAGVSAWWFGSIHPIGIIAAIVVIPLTTVFMAASIVWLGLDIVVPPLSGLTGRFLSLLYRITEQIVSLAGDIPGITAPARAVIWLSVGLSMLLVCYERINRAARGRIEPFA